MIVQDFILSLLSKYGIARAIQIVRDILVANVSKEHLCLFYILI